MKAVQPLGSADPTVAPVKVIRFGSYLTWKSTLRTPLGLSSVMGRPATRLLLTTVLRAWPGPRTMSGSESRRLLGVATVKVEVYSLSEEMVSPVPAVPVRPSTSPVEEITPSAAPAVCSP